MTETMVLELETCEGTLKVERAGPYGAVTISAVIDGNEVANLPLSPNETDLLAKVIAAFYSCRVDAYE